LLHFGQSVDFVVSITFLRSPVFAIFAIIRVFLLLGLSLHTVACSGVTSDRSSPMGWISGRLQRRGYKLASCHKGIAGWRKAELAPSILQQKTMLQPRQHSELRAIA
jgi:hypothetical protein